MLRSALTARALVPVALVMVATVATGARGANPPHVVFATSVSGTGDLGTWPEASPGTEGVDAADSICRNLAQTANLDNPLDFVAWLSDSDDDAYCRVHGLTGKVSANCGQAELPVAAGPWVRTDGFPFAPTIDQLLAPTNAVYTPLRYDEDAVEVTGGFFTGTLQTGVGSGELCTDGGTLEDWASSSGFGRVGSTIDTSAKWTNAYLATCGMPMRLICMEKGQGGPLPPFAQVAKLAFVTSAAGNGQLGTWAQADPGTSGIEAGDSICRDLADAAHLPGPDKFRAWLSDAADDAYCRVHGLTGKVAANCGQAELPVAAEPWVRVDGVVVFPSSAELSYGGLFASLNVTESGAYTTFDRSWTGTLGDGTAAYDRCDDWLTGTAGPDGQLGLNSIVTPGWTSNVEYSCGQSHRLYCLATDTRIFADGFEGGDTTAWSTTASR